MNWGAAPAPQGTGLPGDPVLGGFLAAEGGGVSAEGVSRCLLAPNASWQSEHQEGSGRVETDRGG